MKKVFISIVMACACICFTNLNAQVTIGSNSTPDANAVLDLISGSSKGLLLPRLALSATNLATPLSAHVAGMTVYNTATTSGSYAVTPGMYYNDGTKWVRLPLGYTNWFYMPSISFDTSSIISGQSKDLYTLYKNQFSSPLVKSTGAPSSVPYVVPNASDLYYYITDYDTAVFANVSINASGVMSYDVISNSTDCSYINIVFVLK
ncbi:MAG: hypothetical protein WCK78_03360 [Paludibacter sp.]